ncbi:hypothetical protein FFJ24_005635 [Pedobacter sp. KBS0701]|uniref:hypothetical protein n=1 Tax=Pedobacter sp. KBS0701 TaxID=2578106 RepID=UPI00110D4FD7|nr:hypothetical protein [Pedobacter sp. KBS0701]QDW24332.1 hypothetical protein FFJ24_005635 [Pedobacter sp. KBS0701]
MDWKTSFQQKILLAVRVKYPAIEKKYDAILYRLVYNQSYKEEFQASLEEWRGGETPTQTS